MELQRTPSVPSRDEALRRNPKIDVALVAAHERLEHQLRRLGVIIKPDYGIEPPFGRRPRRLHNHSRPMTRNS